MQKTFDLLGEYRSNIKTKNSKFCKTSKFGVTKKKTFTQKN